ncbi:MAG TPA: UDP-N-acetylmuramate--L-alanine ligase [Verrucomicrobiae bacterium]|nr:UDP-N-acetylmuramate--L-alanine ligase [Verrucomicrobiae bacterium]
MNPLNPKQVDELLRAMPGGAVYLVGAGGCGMSALGHLLLDLGHGVAGSDLAANEEVRQLRSRGAHIHAGHHGEQVRAARPAMVVYSSAIRADNPELAAARELKVPIVRRATLLAALLRRQRGICVAGMHGKTTTSALLSFALERLGARPSYAIGAFVPQLERHARFTVSSESSAPLFVVEADESDGTLREFHPEHAIVLNVDAEHLDYYAGLEAICREFQAFGELTRGLLIFCADDPRLAELFAERPGAISYGFNPLAAYRIEAQTGSAPAASSPAPAASRFNLWHGGELLGVFTVGLLGEKNASNTAAVVTLLHQLGFQPPEIAAAIAPFRGAARRQEELFADDRFRVFDDYAHHPREIAATIAAFKTLAPRRLLVAFQPHRYTRTQHLLKDFSTCFKGVDKLWLTEVYAASEPEIPGVNGALLADAVQAKGQPVHFTRTLAELRMSVRAAMQPGDLVLFLGAGDITQTARELAAQLRNEMPTNKEQLFAALSAVVSPATVLRQNEPLAKKTTLRVGGPADVYVEPASEMELAVVLKVCAEQQVPMVILGRGSNLLIKDGGIRGVVVSLGQPHFSRIEVVGEQLHCGAGASLKSVANEAKRRGLTRLEFLEGIPGSIGGALRMNAGAMGGWMFDVVETIRFMDSLGGIHERSASEVNVEYRGCPLFKSHIALGAVLKGEPAPRELIEQRMAASNEKRWTSQPRKPSAGCIFKNPKSIPAGKLIDELGLKGTRVGGAVVSDVHGNFIVNEGNATAQDVLGLIEIVRRRAKSTRGIDLETEVEILGE